jgi:maltose O-acetyltransferase
MNNDRLFFIIQSCIKYNSFNWGIKLRSFLYKPFFKKFGSNIQIKDGVTFKYPSEIELGNNCKIGEFSYFVGKGGLTIGNNLLLGAGTKIITSSHNFEETDIPIFEQGLEFSPVIIGNDVWFGFDVKVFGNTDIGSGVIIGAGSIVKNMVIPDYSVVVGAPGKVIRNRNGN